MSGIESNLPNDLRDLLITIIAFTFIYETKIMLIYATTKKTETGFSWKGIWHTN